MKSIPASCKRFLFAAAIMLPIAAEVVPAAAQVDFGTGVGPEVLPYGYGERPKRERVTMTPMALATSLAFDSTTWASVNVSTSETPAQEIFHLQQKGYYKLEIFQLVLIAKKSGTSLQTLVPERDKGERLDEIAKKHSVDFDENYDDSLALQTRIEDIIMPTIMTVSISSAPAKVAEAPPPRPAKKRRR